MSASIGKLVDRQVLLWRLRQAALTRQLRMRRLSGKPGLRKASLYASAAAAALESPPKSGVRHRIPNAAATSEAEKKVG